MRFLSSTYNIHFSESFFGKIHEKWQLCSLKTYFNGAEHLGKEMLMVSEITDERIF